MKKTASFILLLNLIFLNAYAHENDMPPEKEKHVFRISGISCRYCVIEIRKILKETIGFQSVEVNPKENTVMVYTDKGICYSDEQLIRLFDDSGFDYQNAISRPANCEAA